MDDVILIITEGLKPEHKKLNEIKDIFLQQKRNIVLSPDVGHIINLCNDLDNDPDLDYLSWLKENGKTNENINSLSLDNISEIYLFFDYDCHGITKAGYKGGNLDKYNEDLLHLLDLCNESTSQFGKLYISYPMIESLWDIPVGSNFTSCNNNCFFPIDKIKQYKKIINDKYPYKCRPMNKEAWQKFLSIHLDRFLICTGSKKYENLSDFSYFDIIDYDLSRLHQIESYLSENENLVFAINPLPLFLLEIGGPKQFSKFVTNLQDIKCNCTYIQCSEKFKDIIKNI